MAYTDFCFCPKLIVLLVIVAMVQLLFKRKQTHANTFSKVLLLAFSFYTLWYYNIGHVLCISAVILIVYFDTLLIGRSDGKVRKCSTVTSVVILVVFLGVFKYLNFFASAFCNVAGLKWTEIHMILPLGISFYIFGQSAIFWMSAGKYGSGKESVKYRVIFSIFPETDLWTDCEGA